MPVSYGVTLFLKVERAEGRLEVRVEGPLALADCGPLWAELEALEAAAGQGAVRFDLSGAVHVDGAAAALLVQTRRVLNARGAGVCDFAGATGPVAGVLALYDLGEGRDVAPPVPPGALARIGEQVYGAWVELRGLLDFVGRMVRATGGVLRHPRTANWRDLGPLVARTGTDAVPIVVLITFLVGLVMAFQAAVQLKQFGANIYVADLVGLSITRELGPLMTAIIVCGRSGAAFAAELGTMQVSEEVDALRTMGIGPLRYLVMPRVLALVIVLPVLALLGDFVGVVGGLAVGVTSLDLTVLAYANQTQRALSLWDVGQGLMKAGVFGAAIGLISCAQGLATTGGAEGVGRRTTSSVVVSLFAIILIDTAFTFAFHELGL
ncbi:MAG: MlaE family lipid ABC transporter permease subunit [Bradymonadia bacterium]